MTKIKICGLKKLEEVKYSVENGADFVGLVLVSKHHNCVSETDIAPILEYIQTTKCKSVAIFQNQDLYNLKNVIKKYRFDFVQLHGNESVEYCKRIRSFIPVMKVFGVDHSDPIDSLISTIKTYENGFDYVVLDRKIQGKGDLVNVELARRISAHFKTFLAGGLNPQNVSKTVLEVQPFGVDVSGGVKTDSTFDKRKIKTFINAVKSAGPAAHQPQRHPRKKGYFGSFGGQFVSELLYPALLELESAFNATRKDPIFEKEYKTLLTNFANRPTPLYYAKNLSSILGCRVYLKREDMLPGGSHKLNNTLGQVLLAKKMGKKQIITETAAGMHGVATCMAARLVGLPVTVFMGVKDIARQSSNVDKIKLLGGTIVPVTRGEGVLKDAVSEALSVWIEDVPSTHYLIGSTVGPHPYPTMVGYFQRVIGIETKRQILKAEKKLPTTIIACGSGGSNATGMFQSFEKDSAVELVFVEGAEAAAFKKGRVGIFQGCKTYAMLDEYGMDRRTNSRAAGLNYPARSPYLSDLYSKNRLTVKTATDRDVLETFQFIAKTEGILPAFETCHALAELLQRKGKYKKDDVVVVCFSGSGEKDVKNL